MRMLSRQPSSPAAELEKQLAICHATFSRWVARHQDSLLVSTGSVSEPSDRPGFGALLLTEQVPDLPLRAKASGTRIVGWPPEC